MFVIALACPMGCVNAFSQMNWTWDFVPRLLHNEQWDHWVQVCTELQNAVRHDPNFLSRVITVDESWLCNYDSETKLQSSQWKMPSSPRPKKARQLHSNIKSLLIIFFWHSRNCAQGVCSTQSDCQWEVLLRGFEMNEGKCEVQTASDAEERRLVVAPWRCPCTHLACEGIPDKQ
jgi:hypothetical protein